MKEILKSRRACELERAERVGKSGRSSPYIKSLDRKIKQADDLIFSVDDYRLRLVLVCRYIKGMTTEETAEYMHYSPRQIRRLHRRALELLEGKK